MKALSNHSQKIYVTVNLYRSTVYSYWCQDHNYKNVFVFTIKVIIQHRLLNDTVRNDINKLLAK
jgi:hypothetical protein